jgi:hypothetical protein
MQPPGGARLSVKPLPKNLILRVRCRQQLHCHHTVHDGVLGLIYLAEPAPAQQPPQPVVPEPRPGRKPSGVSLSVGSSTTPSPSQPGDGETPSGATVCDVIRSLRRDKGCRRRLIP